VSSPKRKQRRRRRNKRKPTTRKSSEEKPEEESKAFFIKSGSSKSSRSKSKCRLSKSSSSEQEENSAKDQSSKPSDASKEQSQAAIQPEADPFTMMFIEDDSSRHENRFTNSELMEEEDKESEGSSSGFSEEDSQPNAYKEIAIEVQHKDFETLVLQILKARLKTDSTEKDSGEIEDSKSYVVRTKKSGQDENKMTLTMWVAKTLYKNNKEFFEKIKEKINKN